jgi:protein-S-isoprenylcysteine O-methyltransferase Ste14
LADRSAESAELLFKLAFVAVFLAASTIAARTARAATVRHGGSLNQLSHEARGLIWIRAGLGLVFYAALFAWLFTSQRARWAYVDIPVVVRWAAVAGLVPVLIAFRWSFATLGTNYRGGLGLYDQHELVVRGPYSTVRHPIYAAFIAIMVLVFLVSANWVLGLSGLLLVTSIAVVRIPQEERQLQERFGAAWNDYTRQTRVIIPHFGRRMR